MIIKRGCIGGLYRFPATSSNQEIVEAVLKDFCIKLGYILREYWIPCKSLDTYEIFKKRWEINNSVGEGEEIYSEIPSDFCASWIQRVFKIPPEITKKSFGEGEFPLIIITKKYHPGRDELHITYKISR